MDQPCKCIVLGITQSCRTQFSVCKLVYAWHYHTNMKPCCISVSNKIFGFWTVTGPSFETSLASCPSSPLQYVYHPFSQHPWCRTPWHWTLEGLICNILESCVSPSGCSKCISGGVSPVCQTPWIQITYEGSAYLPLIQ